MPNARTDQKNAEPLATPRAHREAADGNPARVEVVPPRRGRDHLAEDVRAPAAVGPVVVVRVVAPVREDDDRRPLAELPELARDRRACHRVRTARPAVEEDEERPAFGASRRDDRGLLERAPDVAAVDLEVLGRAARLAAAGEERR